MAEILMEYIIEEALIVVPMLWVIGKFMKSTPNMKDWMIPYVLLLVGVTTTTFMLGFNVDSMVQGVLVSGTAVFSNELFKQYSERNDD